MATRHVLVFVVLTVECAVRPSLQQDCRVLADCADGTVRWRNLQQGSVGPPGKRGPHGRPGSKGDPGLGVNVTALKEQLQPDKGPKLYHIANTLTWDSAKSFCANFDRTLCSFDLICPPNNGGRSLINDVIPGDHWVPVLNEHNEWCEIGDHHHHACFLHSIWSKPTWGTTTVAQPYKGYVYCCEMGQGSDASLPNIVYQYIGKTLTYDTAKKHCVSQARRLCYSSEICQRAKPQFGTINGDMWVAAEDRHNDWIQIGSNPHKPCLQHGAQFGLPPWGKRTDGSRLEHVGFVYCCSRGTA